MRIVGKTNEHFFKIVYGYVSSIQPKNPQHTLIFQTWNLIVKDFSWKSPKNYP